MFFSNRLYRLLLKYFTKVNNLHHRQSSPRLILQDVCVRMHSSHSLQQMHPVRNLRQDALQSCIPRRVSCLLEASCLWVKFLLLLHEETTHECSASRAVIMSRPIHDASCVYMQARLSVFLSAFRINTTRISPAHGQQLRASSWPPSSVSTSPRPPSTGSPLLQPHTIAPQPRQIHHRCRLR